LCERIIAKEAGMDEVVRNAVSRALATITFNAREAAGALLEKRSPVFEGR